jgi:hypothetical protein
LSESSEKIGSMPFNQKTNPLGSNMSNNDDDLCLISKTVAGNIVEIESSLSDMLDDERDLWQIALEQCKDK